MEPVKFVTMAALIKKQRKICSSEMLIWIFAVTLCSWRSVGASTLTGKPNQNQKKTGVNDQAEACFLLLLPQN